MRLREMANGASFRLAGVPYRTGILISSGTGSAKVEYHTVFGIKTIRGGQYKAIIRYACEGVIISPETSVLTIDDNNIDWDDTPLLLGQRALKSSADIAKEGWTIGDKPVSLPSSTRKPRCRP